MARREKFSAYLECPECGKKGNAVWEENENPVHNSGDLGRSLESISSGFGAVRNAVGIRCGAFSGNMKVSFQAARSQVAERLAISAH